MPRKAGKKGLHIEVAEEELEQVKSAGKARGYPIYADYIRYLIEKDSLEMGQPIKFAVDRGGSRHKKSE